MSQAWRLENAEGLLKISSEGDRSEQDRVNHEFQRKLGGGKNISESVF